MEDDFLTVLNSPTSKIIRKRSIFYGFMEYVCSKVQAENFLKLIKYKNKGAKHNVWAYVLNSYGLAYCNDDGEPSRTAGEPVLNVLKRNCVFDVCVVVTRYFGGIKLGTGGLVEAYSSACKCLFDKVVFAKSCFCVFLEIKISYSVYSSLNYFLKLCRAEVVDIVFESDVKVFLWIEEVFYSRLKTFLLEKIGKNFGITILKKARKRMEITQNELEEFKLKGNKS